MSKSAGASQNYGALALKSVGVQVRFVTQNYGALALKSVGVQVRFVTRGGNQPLGPGRHKRKVGKTYASERGQ